MKVRNGGFLAFINLDLVGPAFKQWTASNDTYLVDAAFASLPSIQTEPNATVRMALRTDCFMESQAYNLSHSVL